MNENHNDAVIAVYAMSGDKWSIWLGRKRAEELAAGEKDRTKFLMSVALWKSKPRSNS